MELGNIYDNPIANAERLLADIRERAKLADQASDPAQIVAAISKLTDGKLTALFMAIFIRALEAAKSQVEADGELKGVRNRAGRIGFHRSEDNG